MRPLNDAEIPVSVTDELAVERGEKAEHIRRFGEYKSTNTPLSEQELKDREAHYQAQRDQGAWPHSTTKAVHEIVPVEDKPSEDGAPEV